MTSFEMMSSQKGDMMTAGDKTINGVAVHETDNKHFFRLDITYNRDADPEENEAAYYGDLWEMDETLTQWVNLVEHKMNAYGYSVHEVLINFMPVLSHMIRLGHVVVIEAETESEDAP